MCTWTFGPLPLEAIAARLEQLGFDGVELYGDVSLDPRATRRLLEAHGLEVYSLTPMNVDLTHPEPWVRRAALDDYARLIEFARALGGARVSCHGHVGRFAPLADRRMEWGWLVEALQTLAETAAQAEVTLVFEVLNRYETHLVHTTAEALELLEAVGHPNLKVLLDAYHMNLEEPDPAAAIRRTGDRLGLVHLADSNRRGIGHGHTDFPALLHALQEVGYTGPLILEVTAPGPDPFTPVKEGDYLAQLEADLKDSLTWLRAC
ncbi:Xylose isomerase domain-containing protein TIM barrel [Marinithermus hydrothermalis DSM 14884]|uniref:Xylose isomerase domain-containing protein TIM barrel n=1 Tax=Marinithermus hydrothermalis (strain DSM 14884 / JCM 11576 / T1) TaxID=869210 RepID=F2NMF2_MARHT|nr:Xylose isomerase domain-containing protein TIM barrel [Marinithermus hydrothermalis DSM 14884]